MEDVIKRQQELFELFEENNKIINELNYEDLELLLNYLYKINNSFKGGNKSE